MSETQPNHGLAPEEDGGQSRAPHRVIGTPPPAEARTLLGGAPGSAEPEAPRELPAGPDNPAKAKTARRSSPRASSCRCSRASASSPPMSAWRCTRSTRRCAPTWPLACPSRWPSWPWASAPPSGSGRSCRTWSRSKQRHPLASDEQEREAFAKTFTEGAEASGFVKRPLLRRTLIAASGHKDRSRPRAGSRHRG